MADRPDVFGYIEELDSTRLVFVGQRAAEPDQYYVGFRNSQGVDTKLILSTAALDALVRLRAMIDTIPERCAFPRNLTNNQAWNAVVSVMIEDS